MAEYPTSNETIYNLGFWLIVDSDIKNEKNIRRNRDQLNGLISALIDRGVNTSKKIRRWMRANGLKDGMRLVDSILTDHEGSDQTRHLWKLGKRYRYSLLFDFAPYRYDIAQRVADLSTSKDVLIYR